TDKPTKTLECQSATGKYKDEAGNMVDGELKDTCGPSTPGCKKVVNITNADVVVTCSENGMDCMANVTCKEGYAILKIDSTRTTRQFVCDVQKREWV
ncbi:hypothetical protein PMAYCL1PPCAC_17877, partial [Pristionchus mayeri]